MIAKLWRGRTAAADAEAYGAFLQRTAHPDYGGVEGNRGWVLLRREAGDAVEFGFLSLWDSMDAVRRYAGEIAERPKYYPEDERYLLERPGAAELFEVVDTHLRP
jgi:heme-degrading monooxygenase HmoA